MSMSQTVPPLATPPQADVSGVRTARRLGVNAVSLLAGDVLNRGATFAVYALVARYCGPYSFGQLSLGLMLLYAFQVLASLGLPTLIVRDVAKTPSSDSKYLLGASVLVTGAFVLCYALLGLFVVASQYAVDTATVVMLVGLSILPWSLSLIAESIIRAHERMHLILWAAVPVNLLKVALAFYLLHRGYSVYSIAILLFVCHALLFVIQTLVLMRSLRGPFTGVDVGFCRSILRSAWRFFGIDAIVAIMGSVNVVLLSWFAGEAEVGIFVAAVQLLMPPGIALQAIVNSLFPIMCRRAAACRESSRQLIHVMFEALMFVAIPGSVLLWFCAQPLIELVYSRDGFESSTLIIRIAIPTLVLSTLTRLLGQLLMSNQREGINLRIVAIDLTFNMVIGLILIPWFGVVGAAITLVLTSFVNFTLHYLSSRELLAASEKSAIGDRFVLLCCTSLASILMAATLHFSSRESFWWLVLVGSLAFITSFILFACLFIREMKAYRRRFLTPLSENS